MSLNTDKKTRPNHDLADFDQCEQSELCIRQSSPGLLWQSAKRQCRYLALVMPALLAVLISGCGSIDMKRMTYDMLRQQDCLVNEFDEVCTRSYALDYYDYKQVRNSYLQSISATENVSATQAIAVTSEAVSLRLSNALGGTQSSQVPVPNAKRVVPKAVHVADSWTDFQASHHSVPSL